MNKDYENLEEIIDLCKEELEDDNQDTTVVLDLEDLKSLNNILVDYKRILKENEKLNVKILSNAGIYQLGFRDGEKTYIQKVKDKIEEKIQEAEKDLQKAIELEKETKTKEDSILWWTAQIRLDERIKVLKEILKEVKKDGNGDNV